MIRKINALLRFHFKIDPEKLTPWQWANRWRELQYALDFESKRFSLKDGETLNI